MGYGGHGNWNTMGKQDENGMIPAIFISQGERWVSTSNQQCLDPRRNGMILVG